MLLNLNNGWNMKLFAKSLLVGSMALASTVANAELVNSDWLTVGDGLSVYDETSGLTWLDLSVTQGMSYNDAGDIVNARYATWSELETLVNLFFGKDLNTINGPTEENTGLVFDWINLFGTTTDDNFQSNGYIGRANGTLSDFQVYNTGSYAHIWQANDNMSMVNGMSAFGSYMIVEASEPNTEVPVPASLSLFALVMAAFGARRKYT